jgi:hypothetical protein
MLSTFAFVTFAWIFFRAENLTIAVGYIKKMCLSTLQHPTQLLTKPIGAKSILYIVPLIIVDWYLRNNERDLRVDNKYVRAIMYLIAILVVRAFLSIDHTASFIYFQF